MKSLYRSRLRLEVEKKNNNSHHITHILCFHSSVNKYINVFLWIFFRFESALMFPFSLLLPILSLFVSFYFIQFLFLDFVFFPFFFPLSISFYSFSSLFFPFQPIFFFFCFRPYIFNFYTFNFISILCLPIDILFIWLNFLSCLLITSILFPSLCRPSFLIFPLHFFLFV